MSLDDGRAVRSWTLHLLCMPVLMSSKIVESNDMSSKKLSPSSSRETETYAVQSGVVSTGHGGSGGVKSVRSTGMMSIESTDGALASRHLRRRARSRSPKHERADKTSLCPRCRSTGRRGTLSTLLLLEHQRLIPQCKIILVATILGIRI